MSLPRRLATSANFGTLFLLAVALALVALPAAGVIRRLRELPRPEIAIERVDPFREWSGALALGQTALWCGLIGLLAAVLALGWAWWMRGLSGRARVWAMGIGLAPMLLPSYLAYAGWNLLRAPGTWLGDALAVAPPWASVWAWRAMAIGGLTLWVWPVALLVLAPAAASVPRSMLDAMRTDGAGTRVLFKEVLRLLAPDVARAAALVALVMAGSAVPLHVAQVYTYSIWLWSEMNRVPDLRGVWLASWPMLALAVLGAMFILRLVPGSRPRGGEPESPDLHGRSRPRAAAAGLTAFACALWSCSVIVPLLLFVLSVREPSAFAAFVRESGAGIANSAHVGVWVGAIGGAILLAVWVAIANAPRDGSTRIARQVVLWLAVIGLVPGVLVGSAFAQAAPASGMALVVMTHLARFAFIAAIIGWWLAAGEPEDLRDARELDGGRSGRGWLAACVWPASGVVAGAAVALAMLSLHEIESTIQVLPPGLDNLAQYLLDQLHYLRQDQLAAAGAMMTGFGLAGALAGGVLAAKSLIPTSERS